MVDLAEQFMQLMCKNVPDDERIIVASFGNSPDAEVPYQWRPSPYIKGMRFPENNNNYITISSFKIAADGTWRRKQENQAEDACAAGDPVSACCLAEKPARRLPRDAAVGRVRVVENRHARQPCGHQAAAAERNPTRRNCGGERVELTWIRHGASRNAGRR